MGLSEQRIQYLSQYTQIIGSGDQADMMAQAQLRSDITDVSLSPSQHWACLEGEPSDVPKYGFRSWANSPLDRYLPDPAIRSYGEKMSDLPTPDEEAPMTTTTDPALAILLSAHNPTSSARLDTVVRNAA